MFPGAQHTVRNLVIGLFIVVLALLVWALLKILTGNVDT
jgi:hypothetical protein